MKIPFLAVICLLIFGSCTKHHISEDEEKIKSVTDNFADQYFNFNLKEAMQFCTPESEKWIKFIASNITQEDIDVLKNKPEGATHNTDEIIYVNDTLANIKCHVFNVMKIDTIGLRGRVSEHEIYNINVVKRGDKWMIKMEGPLQSGKQNHD
ncbi:hypothetical protein [uncultured Prevotella sp.]|uniref:hypothetical protein n=1 Tax=uncultured Prevotella sp. TaxID=159272 RepID=UPI00262EB097|nr:hypothetical protein [uncultured Prevotella sp.]